MAGSRYIAQFTDISQSLQYSLKYQADQLERFTTQFNFAHQLCEAHPGRAKEWQERIVEAGRIVQKGLEGKCIDLQDLVAKGEAALLPIGQVAKGYTLLCISHAHIDMNWMWSWPETVAVTNDTFQTMLTLMDEFPGFIYSQSQASTYRLVEKYNPPKRRPSMTILLTGASGFLGRHTVAGAGHHTAPAARPRRRRHRFYVSHPLRLPPGWAGGSHRFRADPLVGTGCQRRGPGHRPVPGQAGDTWLHLQRPGRDHPQR